ncbi:MAG: hypothetical protein ACXW1M_00710 [Acidimicrobiia bacterium]
MHELREPSNVELAVGTRVEVRDRFCAGWNSGFEIAATTRDAYRVRRLSDAYVLPVEFAVVDLRPANAR